MDYSDFFNEVLDAVKERMRDSVRVYSRSVLKNNGVRLWGIMFEEAGNAASPTIYAEQYYEMYNSGSSIDEIADMICDTYERSKIRGEIDLGFLDNYSAVKDKLLCKIISYDFNEELLTEVPYRRFLDLAIVPYLSLDDTAFGDASVLVRRNLLNIWDINEEELIDDAMSNTYNGVDSELIPIGCLIDSIMRNNSIGTENSSECLCESIDEEKCPMYVLTNPKRIFGAIFMASSDVLSRCSSKLGGDFYLLPSSVHEVILLPAEDSTSYEYLSQMVREINDKELNRSEVLSDHAYIYRSGYGLQCTL